MVPIQPELDFLLQAWAEKGFHIQTFMIGRLLVMHLPKLDVTLACGGLGKVQFAVQTVPAGRLPGLGSGHLCWRGWGVSRWAIHW